MLKFLPTCNLNQPTKAKCGEIFCDRFKELTICCCFCKIKLFAFDDFIFHLQNVHFENNLPKAETITNCNEYLKEAFEDDTSEVEVFEQEEEYESLDLSYDCNEDEDNSGNIENASSEEETLKVINVKQRRVSKKTKTKTANKRGVEELQSDGLIDVIVENLHGKVQQFPCPDCNKLFTRKADLDQHVFKLHKGFKCSMCDKRFRHRHHQRRHIQNIHNAQRNEERIPCPMEYCGRTFADQEYLKHHLEVHTMERTIVCDFENCGKAFQTPQRLRRHKYTHELVKKFICDICGYSCRCYISLNIHQRIHTGERPFACKICKKCFSSKTTLNIHMISHSSKRPYVCQICQATFAKMCILRRHSFIHSEEKTFKCKLCDKAFKQPHGLDGHMRRLHLEPKSNKDKPLE